MTNQPQADQINETNNSAIAVEFTSGWNVLRHELLYLLWALMELAILTPLLFAFAPWTRFWPPGLLVIMLLLLMLIPFNLGRLMSTLEINVERQRLILALGLIITVIIAWRLLLYSPRPVIDAGWIGEFFNHLDAPDNPFRIRDITIFAVVALLWWRGLSLIGRHVDISEIGFRMRFEILLLFIFVAVIAGSLLPSSVTPFIMLFFFTALLAIVITRVEQLELGRSGQSFPITFRWLFVVTGASALIAFTTGALAGALSNESMTRTVGWFSPLWEALRHMAIVVVAIIAYLFSPVIIFLSWLFGLITGALEPMLQETLQDLDLVPQASMAEQFPEELMEATETAFQFPRQLMTILIMLFVILFVTLALGRMVRSLRKTSQGETQALNPLADFGSFHQPGLGRRILDRFGAFRRWRAAASIRHLYREMCQTAADHGYPRAVSETPYEYLHTLIQAWPGGEDETLLITEAYVRVHYGELPENQEEMARIEEAWKRLESTQPAAIKHDVEDVSVRRL